MMKTLSIVGHSPLVAGLASADVVIEPEMDSIEFTDFHRAAECFLLGQRAAETMVPEIRRKLAQD
jgi:predicted acylesterase/phospholipase RssA